MKAQKPQVPISKLRQGHMEVSHARAERFYLKLSLGILFGILLIIAVSWGGHDLYVRWQEKRLVRRAISALGQGDDNTAGLAARAVLQIKPSSVPAARIVAELGEKAGNRVALVWRRRVVDLNPASVDDRLALARCALQFNEMNTAEKAVAGIDEPGRQRAGYHAIEALLAQARRQDEKAETEWDQAVQLAPDEKSYQLQLGTLRLRSRDKDRQALGEAMLTALRDDPKQRVAATRALITGGITQRANVQHVLQLARELQAYPEATLADRLLYLGILYQLSDPEFSSYLTELEKSTAKKPVELTGLLAWMSQNDLNLLALDFVNSLSQEDSEEWPVPLARADIYVRLKDWAKLVGAIKTSNWHQFDFLRHAYLARALRAQDNPVAAEREWTTAVKGASTQSESLLTLTRTASAWKWDKEATDLLWQLSKIAEAQAEAFHTLYVYYTNTKDTQGLYRVLVRLFEMDPADLKVQNNLTQISLLLNADMDRAQKLASDLYRKDASDPALVATYAYALFAKGNAQGAVKVMESLTGEQLRDPAVAAYYGVFLNATGEKAKAKEFLELGASANLLPEEKAIVKKAASEVSLP